MGGDRGEYKSLSQFLLIFLLDFEMKRNIIPIMLLVPHNLLSLPQIMLIFASWSRHPVWIVSRRLEHIPVPISTPSCSIMPASYMNLIDRGYVNKSESYLMHVIASNVVQNHIIFVEHKCVS